jgi:hypothetical protein
MDSPYHYPSRIRLESIEGEPTHADEMFVARREHFPELAMAESSLRIPEQIDHRFRRKLDTHSG